MDMSDEDWKALVARTDGRFAYSALNEGEFRTLVLHPGEWHEPILCQIAKQHIQHIQVPYAALSYTWGDPTPTDRVRCILNARFAAHATEGARQDLFALGELSVTNNLLIALRRFRSNERMTAIWVDALCIDQTSVAEKNQQLQIIWAIFACASKVAIWLGEASDHSSAGLSFLDKMFRNRSEDGKSFVIMTPDEAATRRHWEGIREILSRAWFRRAWVRQELAFGSDVGLVCGTDTLPWDTFECALRGVLNAQIAFSTLQSSQRGFRHSQVIAHMRAMVSATLSHPDRNMLRNELLSILFASRDAEATDPRDKVLSLIGMCSPMQKELLPHLDYSLSPEEIFLRAAIAEIAINRNLKILSHAGLGSSKLTGLPSWVPDWSVPARVSVIDTPFPDHGYRAAGDTKAEFEFAGSGRRSLQLTGKHVDEVQSLAEETPSFDHLSTTQKAALSPFGPQHQDVQRWALGIEELRQDCGESVEALWRTLCANKARDTYRGELWQGLQILKKSNRLVPAPSEYSRSFDAWRKVNVAPPDSEQISFVDTEDLKEWQTAMVSAVHNRRFSVTARGRMILAPLDVRCDDLICVLNGGDVPFVLRPIDRGTYQLVGECYVHGLMNGEAIHDHALAFKSFVLE
jgi:Heterokaryon incompatibility protein (HET)